MILPKEVADGVRRLRGVDWDRVLAHLVVEAEKHTVRAIEGDGTPEAMAALRGEAKAFRALVRAYGDAMKG